MGHPRRFYPSGTTYFVTNRLAEGLPFVANLYINRMLCGVLARAASRFPAITICDYLFLANHYHMLLMLHGDPSQLSNFMHYVDGELAKLVVRWLGRRNVKVWAQRYHAAPLLTSESVFQELVYMFANPVNANLVSRVAEWEGCSSYFAFHETTPRKFKWTRPGLVAELPNAKFAPRLVKRLVTAIEQSDAPDYELKIEPFAWMDCFADTVGKSKSDMKQRFFEACEREEKKAERDRVRNKQGVIGARALAEQNPHMPYKPKKFGRRVWCISTCPELRKAYIELYRDLCRSAQESYQLSVSSCAEVVVPLGMFSPPRMPRGSCLPIAGFG